MKRRIIALRSERAFLHGGKANYGVWGTLLLAGDRLVWEASLVGRMKQSLLGLPMTYRRCEIPLSDASFTQYRVSRRWTRVWTGAWLRSLIGAAAVAGFLGFFGFYAIANSDEEPVSMAEFAAIEAVLLGARALLGGLGGPLFLGRVKTRGITAEAAAAVYSFELKDPEGWLRDIEQGEGATPSAR